LFWVRDESTPSRQQLATCWLNGVPGGRSAMTGRFWQQCGRLPPPTREQSPCSVASAPLASQITSSPAQLQLSRHPGRSMCRYSWWFWMLTMTCAQSKSIVHFRSGNLSFPDARVNNKNFTARNGGKWQLET